MAVFTSSIKSISIMDNVRDAFGLEASSTAKYESHSWGDTVTIYAGEHAGTYDVWVEKSQPVKFISA